ncbi:hypothetical protein PFICI_14842 [Pestalotiopsis fici W106-1]|uniref:Uncharacterized protein n=1 Tax=Pestalotiopsis fici (strain W106-1 / CGMCC3.15140) TaxID=1229662 RepID=W3WJD5_PESFW|nr:uncharacterized protein PFICI_14842 [Pestalotiopsis fici W106-1]ETS73237.1 hypothetical protein PFICI_14842 [Pestalotiopsis fici W106-1]
MAENQTPGRALSPDEAWRANIDEIDSALHKLPTRPYAAYIQAAHGAGKSTSLLLYAMSAIIKANPNARIVYVIDSGFEMPIIINYLERHAMEDYGGACVGDFDPEMVLTICTYEQYIDNSVRRQWVPDEHCPIVVLSDVPLRPSVHAEVFFTLLMEQVTKDSGNGMSCMFLAAQFSRRTIDLLRNVFQDDLAIVQVPDINPEVKMILMGVDDVKKQIAARQRDQPESSVVILSVPRPSEFAMGKQHELNPTKDSPQDIVDGNYDAIATTCAAPSFPMPNVGVVVSSGTHELKLWDTRSSQIVTMTKLISMTDFDRQKSWLIKAGNTDQTEFYCLSSESHIKKSRALDDPWSPAFNEDIMWTMLTLCSLNSKVFDMKIRTIPDCFAVHEVMRRLVVMKCIQDSGSGYYPVTSKGRFALELRSKYAHHDLDIHTAMLLARTRNKNLPTNVRRVMIRLAFIIMCGVGSAYSCLRENVPTHRILEGIQQHCEGVGLDQAGKGPVWIILGLYLKAMETGEAVREEPYMFCGTEFSLRLDFVRDVHAHVHEFEALVNIDRIDTAEEVHMTMLSASEVVKVEEQLVLCYASRVMCIATKTDAVYDAASNQPLEYDDDELLDIGKLTRNPVNRDLGAIFAIYLDLVQVSKVPSGRRVLNAKNLIYIPQHVFQIFGQTHGTEWPKAIATSYPLH